MDMKKTEIVSKGMALAFVAMTLSFFGTHHNYMRR